MYTQAEAKQLRRDFWTGFGDYSKTLKYLRANRGRWVLYYTGMKNVELKFDVQRHSIASVLEVNHRSEDKRINVYGQLEQYRKIMDEILGEGFEWDYVFTTESGNNVCRIYSEQDGFDFHRRRDWPMMYKAMGERMIKLEQAFSEVKDFIVTPD